MSTKKPSSKTMYSLTEEEKDFLERQVIKENEEKYRLDKEAKKKKEYEERTAWMHHNPFTPEEEAADQARSDLQFDIALIKHYYRVKKLLKKIEDKETSLELMQAQVKLMPSKYDLLERGEPPRVDLIRTLRLHIIINHTNHFMTIKRPEPPTHDEEIWLENFFDISLEAFLHLKGPSVEFLEIFTHYGVTSDVEGYEVQECKKEAVIYGLLNNGQGENKYQKIFFWSDGAMYCTNTLHEAYDLMKSFFKRDDFRHFEEMDGYIRAKARKDKEAADNEQDELLAAVKKAESLGLGKLAAKGKKAA